MKKVFFLAQVFSCEFCGISKNTYFTEHIWVTASVQSCLKDYNESRVKTNSFRNSFILFSNQGYFLRALTTLNTVVGSISYNHGSAEYYFLFTEEKERKWL